MTTDRKPVFDEHAEEYDGWFLLNEVVLQSEVRLLSHFLRDAGRVLSVGCGSGLFEMLLRRDHGIDIREGVEPSEAMAAIARRRELQVQPGVAESLPHDDATFDTVLHNGTPGYTQDLERAFAEAFRVLKPGGRLVVCDVPAESSYGLLYQLASRGGSWDDPELARLAPPHPYPIELAGAAFWRTTAEKRDLLEKVGFVDLEYAQTLTRHPRYSNEVVEEPMPGFDRGDYVAIRAHKPG